MMSPSRCSTIRTSLEHLTTRCDSRRTSSTSRGSFCTVRARSSALVLGTTSARSIRRPSALDITFCANTSTSSVRSTSPARASASVVKAARSSPAATCGKSGNAMKRSSPAKFRDESGTRLRKCSTQLGQHPIGVEIQEPRLVRARSVKYEVPKAYVDLLSNLFHMLIRIRRHDPTRGGALRRKLIREPFHFERILDRNLLLG